MLVAAFDAAWRSLLASGITFQSDRESKAACDTVAKYIIEQARYGERYSAAYVMALCCNTPSQS
jgi:aspartate/glutamate racemase